MHALPPSRSVILAAVRPRATARFGGKTGINELTELRWITIQTTPRHYPF
jgi:benzaldehyde dehydrogenase (NAD)